jgi:hypothetical protein
MVYTITMMSRRKLLKVSLDLTEKNVSQNVWKQLSITKLKIITNNIYSKEVKVQRKMLRKLLDVTDRILIIHAQKYSIEDLPIIV